VRHYFFAAPTTTQERLSKGEIHSVRSFPPEIARDSQKGLLRSVVVVAIDDDRIETLFLSIPPDNATQENDIRNYYFATPSIGDNRHPSGSGVQRPCVSTRFRCCWPFETALVGASF
jgi:hypothetical protein